MPKTEPGRAAKAGVLPSPGELNDGYYVHAFLIVVESVIETSADLLSDAESAWVNTIREVSEDARRLYVRLLQRRPSTFRLSKLAYTDITDIPAARQELIAAGLAEGAAPEEFAQLLAGFTLPELKRLLPVDCAQSASRAQRVGLLIARADPADRETLLHADRWIGIRGHEHFSVFKLCFFGNLYQDLSEFVTTALGTHRYPAVKLDRNSRYFQTRAQIDAHLRCFECAQGFEIAVTSLDREALARCVDGLPSPIDGDAHLDRRLNRLRVKIGRTYERLGENRLAIEIYQACSHAEARERCVRVLERIERRDEANQLLQRMYRQPESESEYDFAARKLKLADPRAKAFRPSVTSLVLARNEARVEQDVLRFFAREGACFWVENRLFTSLLGLWAWDIIFLPIRGAFFNPFQSAPADFRDRSFFSARREAFEQRFVELDVDHALERRVMQNLDVHEGTLNPLVNWEIARSTVLSLAMERVPRQALAAVFRRLLSNPSEYATGLPDLVHFPEAGGYELIEVKGPGDALQANQRRWFRYFNDKDIPARVVKVRWTSHGRD